MKLADKLFETALKDLESVEILYSAKCYNVALFQFQQSVEKIIKSFGLKVKILNPEEIRTKINHLPHKVFTKLYENQIEELNEQINYKPILLEEMIPPHERDKSKLIFEVERLTELKNKLSNHNEIKKVDNVTPDEIRLFLDGVSGVLSEKNSNEKELFERFKDEHIKTHQHMIKIFKGDENIKSISEQFIANADLYAQESLIKHKESIKVASKYQYISYIWLNLSLITAPHEQTTRYPSIDIKSIPSVTYNKDHYIVTEIPTFVKLLKETIVKYKEIYN